MVRVRENESGFLIQCPGCGTTHLVGRSWHFNGNLVRPTFSPSLKVTCSSWQNIQQDQWMPVTPNGKHLGQAVEYRVPFAMLSEKYAQRYHDQSLARLAERGGLSAHEALCHLDRVGLWDRQATPDDHEEVTRRVRQWIEDVCLPAICHSFIEDGMIRYLSDCTHALVNQTVALPELQDSEGRSSDAAHSRAD